MFMGPLEQVKPWQTSGIQGVRRFLERVQAVVGRPLADATDVETERLVHKTVKKVTHDIEGLRYNTAISTMMILTNHLHGLPAVPRSAAEKLVLCLAPFAPHLAEELWSHALGHPPSISNAPFPAYDEALCVDDVVEIAVQVNGKVRGKVALAPTASEDEARTAALADENVQKHIAGKAIRKVIYVPGRILNVIIG
jgi:leucyl-tRNA synthetase